MVRFKNTYLMEHPDEAIRLDVKTNSDTVKSRAAWCGIRPGMRVLDAGCGSGRTSSILRQMIQPDGQVVGIDLSKSRIDYACKNFGNDGGIEFMVRDFRDCLDDLGEFDVIWVQFVLEYFKDEALEIVGNLTSCLKKDGYLCLLDLDNNSLNHYPMSECMEKVVKEIMDKLEKKFNFDPFAGRKLYSHLSTLRFREIELNVTPHHLICGQLSEKELFNWGAKIEIAAKKVPESFASYPGGVVSFIDDFMEYLKDPTRFVYSPLIMAKGKKPEEFKRPAEHCINSDSPGLFRDDAF